MSVALNSYASGAPCSDTCKRAHRRRLCKCAGGSGRHIVADIGELLRHRCLHGCEPELARARIAGMVSTVIANAIRSWREQEAATQDPLRKKHWREYPVEAGSEMERAISAFDTLDLEATA